MSFNPDNACKMFYEHPMKRGVPIRSCFNPVVEGSDYCLDHQDFHAYKGGMTFTLDESITDISPGMTKVLKEWGFPLADMTKDLRANLKVSPRKEHQKVAKEFQFSDKFLRIHPDHEHNDMLDATRLAFQSLANPKLPKEQPWIFPFLYFFLGFGTGLFLSYMIFLFTLMN